jgi:putative ABC transport system permease protein
LIATEVGLTVVLLIAAALMVKSFSHLTRVDPGFKAENLLIFDIGLSPGTDEAHNRAFYEAVSERLVGLPGVERVGAVSRLPMSGGNSTRDFNVLGREKSQSADIRVITPDYFRTMGIPLLRGRAFNTHDIKTSAPIAVINEACAREIFPDEDPLGKFVVNFGPDKETLQIIGVVGNIRHLALDVAPRAELYQPIGQAMWPRMFFRGIDSNVALGNPRTMEDVIARSLTNRRFTMNLLGIFAGIAVALASIGLYGVMSYSVAQRTREIGIRMAVGAQRGHVLRLVIRQGMILTALGVAIGLVAAFALTRLMSKLLYAVSATDLTTFIGVSAMLALVALLACWLPARRASGVDPMVALRAE